MRPVALVSCVLLMDACQGPTTSENTGGAATGTSSTSGGGAGSTTAGAGGADASGGAGQGGSGGATVEVSVHAITSRHRYDPGKMFGGWGPHLGHMMRVGSDLWFVDDVCDQNVDCNVLDNHSLGYFALSNGVWTERHTVSIGGAVQQNTATIATPGGELQTFGLDPVAQNIRMCRYAPSTGPLGCSVLPFALGPNANYIGAAISPQGYRLVWWTVVSDGGGGSFHYGIDYGGGWNGPRSGDAAGYNDAAYINVAFDPAVPNQFVMHAQFVSGLAPQWTFHAATGLGDMGGSTAVTWAPDSLASVPQIVSTNDIWIDGQGGRHLFARDANGRAVYFYGDSQGFASPFALDESYRARLIPWGNRLALISGPNAGGLELRWAEVTASGGAIDWAASRPLSIELPADFGPVLAIYPEGHSTQSTSPELNVAVVGQTQQNDVLHVSVRVP